MDGAASTSHWQSIRPWTPPSLTLTVREITSVSVTFILSSIDSGDASPFLASLGLSPNDSSDDEETNDEHSNSSRHIISDALAKDLSVKVNGSSWQRVLMRVDEQADEAVVVVYGLMPGRAYDIDLGIMHGEDIVHGQVTTEGLARTDVSKNDPERIDHELSTSEQFNVSPSSSPSSTSNTLPGSMPTTATTTTSGTSESSQVPYLLTIEDYAAQLRHSLAKLNAEREELLSSLKSARRDAQKADAALRSEIEVLRRASEKHLKDEHRAKQKVLALQEAVKQTIAATKDMETLIEELESELPGLLEQKDRKESDYERVKAYADRVRAERDEAIRGTKSKEEALKNELGKEDNRLEKMNGKKEKLETGLIPELEEKLRELGREIERVEKEPYESELNDEDMNGDADSEVVERSSEGVGRPNPPHTPVRGVHHVHGSPSPLHQQRKRPLHPPHLQPVVGLGGHMRPNFPGRMAPGPIQRPPHYQQGNGSTSFQAHHRQPTNVAPGSAPPAKPQQRLNVSAQTGSNSSSSSGSSPSPSASILSSRAQPFEPLTRLAFGQSTSASRPVSLGTAVPSYSSTLASHAHSQSQIHSAPVVSTSDLNPASMPFMPRMAHLASSSQSSNGNRSPPR